jgi:hypothetical protein
LFVSGGVVVRRAAVSRGHAAAAVTSEQVKKVRDVTNPASEDVVILRMR